MGGAMDLVNGAKKIIIMMNHFDKNAKAKLVKKCTLPLTGMKVVHIIVTELGIFSPNETHFKILKLAANTVQQDLKMEHLLKE